MDKCREQFEKIEWVKERLRHVWWSQNNEYCDTGKHPRANASFLNGALHLFREQQAKVEELQRRNQMLNDNIKEQGQKLVYQNEVIETQAEKLLGLRNEKSELQKRVDAALKKLDKRRDELWSKWKGQADMQDQGAANAFEEAYWILEQALKGEGQ